MSYARSSGSNVVNFVLCGGAGTRLWPISRQKMPKQFIQLFSGTSLFQQTIQRNSAITKDIVVISNADMAHLAKQQLPQDAKARFIMEPVGRNTAPAIALGCFLVDREDIVLVTTSDHMIQKREAFVEAVEQAIALAEQGNIVTFGITPTYAETGFGYIEYQGNTVVSFREKPDYETAVQYLEGGQHLWNSGMFCFKASVLLEELAQYAPNVYTQAKHAYQSTTSTISDEWKISLDNMQKIPSISIDYAVMEHTKKIAVVPCDLGWSDLGSFDAMYTEFVSSRDVGHDTVCVQSNIQTIDQEPPWPIAHNSHNNLIIRDNRQVALVNVDDLLVVDTADALLIAKRGSSQDVSAVVKQLRETQGDILEHHVTTHRPWGSFENLLDAQGYKVKRIVVKPKQKLSLQRHKFRAENWTVVAGTAWVRNGEEEFALGVSQSTFIPVGAIHRLENKGETDVVLIEVQTGSYTGEDDIERLEDIYGRC
jgi:mannose-1-phosphate guanylyltransferase